LNYQQLLALFKETYHELQQRAARSVDTSLVIRNWLFGRYIVEFEQGCAERAELYGKSLINRLSSELIPFCNQNNHKQNAFSSTETTCWKNSGKVNYMCKSRRDDMSVALKKI